MADPDSRGLAGFANRGGDADAFGYLIHRHRQILGRAAFPGLLERGGWWLRRLLGPW